MGGFKEKKKINLKEKFKNKYRTKLKWGQSLIKMKITGIYYGSLKKMQLT